MIRLLAALLLLPIAANAAPRHRVVRKTPAMWQAPQCSAISGVRGFGFVNADGTLVRTHGSGDVRSADLPPMTGVEDVVATDVPNQLYALFESVLYISVNAGCTWRAVTGAAPVDFGQFDATHASRIYLHDHDKLALVTPSGVVLLSSFPERIAELFVNPSNARHLRIVAVYGQVYESSDGGATWTLTGDATGWLVNAAAADPSNFDHILVMSTESFPLRTSHDGGRTWSGGQMPRSYPWSVEFSKADPRVVWANAWEQVNGNITNGLYRSLDGGMTWQRVVVESSSLQFSRSRIVPHPVNANAVAFTTNSGVAIFDGALRIIDGTEYANEIDWSPAGTIYFTEWVLKNAQ
jgi:Sortilin, neurotensin receptor 3,